MTKNHQSLGYANLRDMYKLVFAYQGSLANVHITMPIQEEGVTRWYVVTAIKLFCFRERPKFKDYALVLAAERYLAVIYC